MKSSSKGDSRAILNAFRNSESVLRGFVRRFVSNDHDVEDICQETVTRALEAERSRAIAEPRAFLFGVARNVVRKRLDKQSRNLIDFVDDFTLRDFASESPPLEQVIDDRQRMLQFIEVVAMLPPQCQKVFVMKKVYGYSHKEIASKLRISVSTVEKHVAAGMKRCMDGMAKSELNIVEPAEPVTNLVETTS